MQLGRKGAFGIAFSVFTSIILGLEASFNVYAMALKDTFNLTQTEVELIASSGMAGMSLSISESFVTYRFGYKAGYIAIGTLTSGSALLMWLSVVYQDILRYKALLLAAILFLMMELIASSGMAGMSLSISESFVTYRFGYKAGYIAIGTLTSGSALLMWLSVVYQDILRYKALLLAAILFLMSLGQNAGSTRLAAITLVNVPARYTGLFVGLYLACLSLGGLFYGFAFLVVFQEDLLTFFLAVSVTHALTITVCFFTQTPLVAEKQVSDAETVNDELLERNKAEDTSDPNGKTGTTDFHETSFSGVLRSKYFHVVIWPSGTIYALAFTFLNNLTFIGTAVGVAVPLHLVFVMSVATTTGRVTSGQLFDRIPTRYRVLLLLIGYLAVIVGIIIIVTSLNRVSIYLVAVLFGVGISFAITVPCALLSDRYGQCFFQYIIGCMYFICSSLCMLFQFCSGRVYDSLSDAQGLCVGVRCFHDSFIAFLGISIACFVTVVLGHVISYRKDYENLDTS